MVITPANNLQLEDLKQAVYEAAGSEKALALSPDNVKLLSETLRDNSWHDAWLESPKEGIEIVVEYAAEGKLKRTIATYHEAWSTVVGMSVVFLSTETQQSIGSVITRWRYI